MAVPSVVSASSKVPFIIFLNCWDLEGVCSEVTRCFFFFSRNVFGDFYMSCRRVFNNSWSQKKLRNGSSQFYPSTGTGGQDILNSHPPLSGVYKCPEPLKIGSFSLNRSLGLRKYQGMGGQCPCWTWKSHTEATPRGMPSLRDNECSERGSLA